MTLPSSLQPPQTISSSTLKCPKPFLDWNTLLCAYLGKSSSDLLDVRAVQIDEKQHWSAKLLYGGEKYNLKKGFECLKDRDVVADLKILVKQVQLEQWKKEITGPRSVMETSQYPMLQANLPLNRRSVLDISLEGVPKLSNHNWIEWYSLVEIAITPCYLALDILTGKVKEGDVSYHKEIDMELFVFLHKIFSPGMRSKLDEVRKKEGLKGSAAYQVIHHECHLSDTEKFERFSKKALQFYCQACTALVSLMICIFISQLPH